RRSNDLRTGEGTLLKTRKQAAGQVASTATDGPQRANSAQASATPASVLSSVIRTIPSDELAWPALETCRRALASTRAGSGAVRERGVSASVGASADASIRGVAPFVPTAGRSRVRTRSLPSWVLGREALAARAPLTATTWRLAGGAPVAPE